MLLWNKVSLLKHFYPSTKIKWSQWYWYLFFYFKINITKFFSYQFFTDELLIFYILVENLATSIKRKFLKFYFLYRAQNLKMPKFLSSCSWSVQHEICWKPFVLRAWIYKIRGLKSFQVTPPLQRWIVCNFLKVSFFWAQNFHLSLLSTMLEIFSSFYSL